MVRPRVESRWPTLLWGRESPVQRCKGHCLPPLSFHSHPQNLSCHLLLLFLLLPFHRKWHLLSILGPVAQIYVDVSNENIATSPNICRTAVRPFSLFLLHLSLSHFLILYTLSSSFILFFIDLFFQSPSLGRCGFHTWCEMLFLQRLLTHVCKVFSLGGIWAGGRDKLVFLYFTSVYFYWTKYVCKTKKEKISMWAHLVATTKVII